MENLVIPVTNRTPFISADVNGEIKIEGIMIPENAVNFFEPLKNWIDDYKKMPATKTICDVRLDYFNTVAAIVLLKFLKMFNSIRSEGNEVIINWYFEKNDLEIEESGKDFKSLIEGNFNIIETV